MSSTTTTTTTPDEPLILETTTDTGRVRLLTLNRPHALNAISSALSEALFASIRTADADAAIRAIVLTGAGRSFCAGADVKQMSQLDPVSAATQAFLADWNSAMAAVRTPVLAAVNGLALGGGFELVLMCDIVHCSTKASFMLPEINLGTMPGAGGTQRLVSAVGKSTAFQMILTGEAMLPDDALRHGVVTAVHEPQELLPKVIEVAEKIAERSRVVVPLAKEAIKYSQRAINDGLELERRLYYITFGTAAFREGVSSFLDKRKANYDDC